MLDRLGPWQPSRSCQSVLPASIDTSWFAIFTRESRGVFVILLHGLPCSGYKSWSGEYGETGRAAVTPPRQVATFCRFGIRIRESMESQSSTNLETFGKGACYRSLLSW